MRTTAAAVFIGSLTLHCLPAFAEDANSAKPAPQLTTQSSSGDLQGDHITFKSQGTGRIFCRYDLETLAQTCASTPFRAAQDTKISITKTNPATGFDIVTVMRADGCNTEDCIKKDDGNLYVVKEEKMLLYPHLHDGFAWGMLTVPYKYHVGSGQFTSEASLGTYLGYTLDYGGIALTPLASIGFAPISVQTTQGGATTTDNVTAYHWAIGALFSVQKRTGFQAGIVYGKDYVSSSTPYQFNRKPWWALALGYSFQ